MKPNLIRVGGIYHDGKYGVREVSGIDGSPLRVTYTLLASKIEQEYSYAQKQMVSLIGGENACDLAHFAAWAKVEIPLADKAKVLAEIAVKRLKLPPGESAFMQSIEKEFDDELPIKAGAEVSFAFNETRSTRGIEKKGLATVEMATTPGTGGVIVITELGAAWIRARKR